MEARGARVTRRWEVQITRDNPWFSIGFHVDHHDPSITLHLPFLIVYTGHCVQPGFKQEPPT